MSGYTTDTDALAERIARALRQATDDGADRTEDYAAAVLPIVTGEVRRAKVEELREAAGDIVSSAETLPHMTPHDAARGLVRRADRLEAGGSDEHR